MKHFDTLEGWLKWQEGLHPHTIDLGLERVQCVFRALQPDYNKPPTITVAGTNGKGSCVAFLEFIYRAQGYRVGTYTSPHILSYNERIKIDGKPVSDDLICSSFERIESVRDGVSLSYFEFGTLAALDIFSRANLDVQLLEVGLGGRLDAVNIVDPDVSIISSIGIDHADWLGETRELIGREKAGIFRKQVPAIISDPEPPDSISEYANEIESQAFFIGCDFAYRKQSKGWIWYTPDRQIDRLPEPNLKGEHQYRNAAAVVMAVNLMSSRLPITADSIRRGIESVELTGRFQFINDELPVLLDVGHNPQAVKTLVDYLSDNFPDKRIHAVFAMMKDKDIPGVIDIMKPLVHRWYFAPINDNPRCASETMMQEYFEQCKITAVDFGFSGLQDALNSAKAKAGKNDLLLVFGSFFLVSEYLAGLA
ncbi:MAG: bifunctional tetrahydrofolate synthase/dihydrofolate synthase [Gammaproteobacteria bacterium HGW-Gammaproteobacteria-10]|nr:MAG: bifunctional tetrahydrofolate synthase/dihydrofolate synthase [Gammaproteobacteria bacterium HGW-Gammaproteobacteria-10]